MRGGQGRLGERRRKRVGQLYVCDDLERKLTVPEPIFVGIIELVKWDGLEFASARSDDKILNP